MDRILALAAAQWRVATSYRLQTLLSFAGLAVTVVPLYFVSQAVQPVMANAIRNEGGTAFGFLLVGTAVITLVAVSLSAVPTALSGGIASGTLEAMLSTPTSLPVLLAGFSAYPLLMAGLRAAVLVGSGALLGVAFPTRGLPLALLILLLVVVAHLGIGLVSGALVLAFRTPGPLGRAVLVGSSLLGGVYYPTHVVPSWLQDVSAILPLTYGLRALRRVLLQGATSAEVSGDLGVLAVEAAILAALGAVTLRIAFHAARRGGTLAQY